MEAEALDLVDDAGGALAAVEVVAVLDQLPQLLAVEHLVVVRERGIGVLGTLLAEREGLVEDHPAHRGGEHLVPLGHRLAHRRPRHHVAGDAHPDVVVEVDGAVLVGQRRLLRGGEAVQLAQPLLVGGHGLALLGEVVGAEHHVLGR